MRIALPLLVALFALAAGAQADEVLYNWLSDPGAETMPPTSAGWREVTGDWSRLKADAKARDGTAFFWGGAAARAELVQDVSLQDILDDVANGKVLASLRGFVSSFKGDADSSEILMEAVDAQGAVVRSSTTGPKNLDNWEMQALVFAVPAEAVLLRVHLISVRKTGTDNNGYFDSLILLLGNGGGYIPVPGGVPPAARGTSTASTALAVAAPQDRPAPATTLQTVFGRAKLTGTLQTADGFVGGTYADTYLYYALQGEPLAVTLSAPDAQDLSPVLSVLPPLGKPLPVSQGGKTARFQMEAPRTGTYTIRVSAADASRLAGQYTLEVAGRGQVLTGTLDPFVDYHDGARIFDTVVVVLAQPGPYRLDLYENGFRKPEVTVRDNGGRDVLRQAGSPAAGAAVSMTCVMTGGAYQVRISDDVGGEWRLVVTAQGPAGQQGPQEQEGATR